MKMVHSLGARKTGWNPEPNEEAQEGVCLPRRAPFWEPFLCTMRKVGRHPAQEGEVAWGSQGGVGSPALGVWNAGELDLQGSEVWGPFSWRKLFFFFSFPSCIPSWFVFFLIIYFNWRVITSQYCGVFAIHQRESATNIPVVPPPPEAPSHLPPHPVRLGCPRAPTLGALRSLSL